MIKSFKELLEVHPPVNSVWSAGDNYSFLADASQLNRAGEWLDPWNRPVICTTREKVYPSVGQYDNWYYDTKVFLEIGQQNFSIQLKIYND